MGRKTRKEKVVEAVAAKSRVEREREPDGRDVLVVRPPEPSPDLPSFDLDDNVGNLKSDKQTFSRIMRVYASNGMVRIEVDPTVVAGEHGGRPLQNQVLTVREAAERAAELNRMACVMVPADKKMVMEIIESTIRACREAQQQLMAPPDRKIVVGGVDLPPAWRVKGATA